jgi:hypothetical protein
VIGISEKNLSQSPTGKNAKLATTTKHAVQYIGLLSEMGDAYTWYFKSFH